MRLYSLWVEIPFQHQGVWSLDEYEPTGLPCDTCGRFPKSRRFPAKVQLGWEGEGVADISFSADLIAAKKEVAREMESAVSGLRRMPLVVEPPIPRRLRGCGKAAEAPGMVTSADLDELWFVHEVPLSQVPSGWTPVNRCSVCHEFYASFPRTPIEGGDDDVNGGSFEEVVVIEAALAGNDAFRVERNLKHFVTERFVDVVLQSGYSGLTFVKEGRSQP